MLTAFMLITCDRERLPDVGPALAAIDGIAEVYTTTGSFDYIAVARVHDMEALSELVTDRMRQVPGITRTDTHVAMREYSAGDIEAAFQAGSE
ncbi:MAG: Lrp/AsnC ligand binding domain-containing protein [Candidatus Dormiibacterota bacterium]